MVVGSVRAVGDVHESSLHTEYIYKYFAIEVFLVSYFTAYYMNEYNKYSSSKQVHSSEGLLLVFMGAHRVDSHYNAGADRNTHTES